MERLPWLPGETLVTATGVWPWQLTALTFETGATARLVHLSPHVWRPATQDSGPVLETMMVTIVGIETVETPTGAQDAWRVELANQEVAWYTITEPHTLLRYFNGMETWSWMP